MECLQTPRLKFLTLILFHKSSLKRQFQAPFEGARLLLAEKRFFVDDFLHPYRQLNPSSPKSRGGWGRSGA